MKKLTLVIFMVLLSHSAMAIRGVCPELNSHTDSYIKKVTASNSWRRALYFCEQAFSDEALVFSPSDKIITSGGSQKINQGSTNQSVALTTTVNLTGFTPKKLTLNTLQTQFPNTNGAFDSPSLYNFFRRIPWYYECSNFFVNRFDGIRNDLRRRPGLFEIQSGSNTQSFTSDRSSNISILKNENVILTHTSSGKTIPAKVYLYHSNNFGGQFFSRGFWKYCWFGVGVRLEIDLQNANLVESGDYEFNIKVNAR